MAAKDTTIGSQDMASHFGASNQLDENEAVNAVSWLLSRFGSTRVSRQV
jgi:hypothetical protein